MSMKDIEDLTKAIMGDVKKQGKDRDLHYEELMKVVEEKWQDKIVNLGYQRGVLKIGVNSSVIHQEIAQFQKTDWIEALKKESSKIKDIQIKVIDELGEYRD